MGFFSDLRIQIFWVLKILNYSQFSSKSVVYWLLRTNIIKGNKSVYLFYMLQDNIYRAHTFAPEYQENGDVHIRVDNDLRIRSEGEENVLFEVSKLHEVSPRSTRPDL